MSGRALSPASRATASAAALAAFCLGLTATAAAQVPEPPADRDAPRVRLSTAGVYSSFHPKVEVHLSRAAHVAVFEVEPGVGALRMYPFPSDRSVRLEAGTHEFRLNGVRATNQREHFLARLGHRLRARSADYPEAYLVAVASERPLRISELSAGRVFAYRGGSGRAGGAVGSVVAALFDVILPEVGAGDWSWDLHSYSKARDPGLVAGLGSAADPFGHLGAFGCLGYGASPAGLTSFGYDPFGRSLGHGARRAALTMQIALSPSSRTTCRGFTFLFNRLAFGFRGHAFGGPFDFRPDDPPPPEEEPAEGEGEDAGPGVERFHGPLLETGPAADREAVLRRIADARAEGRVTAEQVRGLVREGRLELPTTVTERMRVQAFRRDREVERERRDRSRAWHRQRPTSVSPLQRFRSTVGSGAFRGARGPSFRGGIGVDRRGPVFRGWTGRPAPSPRPRAAPVRSPSGSGGG